MWNVFVDNVDNQIYSKIFPVAQKYVKELVDRIDKEGIDKIILFGSSLTDHCSQDSDLDIAIISDLDEDIIYSKIHKSGFTKSVDILVFEEIVDQGVNSVEHDIIKEGLVIWEQGTVY